MQIFVKPVGSEAFALNIAPSRTVWDTKKEIEKRQCVPISHQRLVFAGVELKDEQKLRDCKLVKDSVIHLVEMVGDNQSLDGVQGSFVGDHRSLRVRLLNGRLVNIQMKPSDGVGAVREKVMAETALALPLQKYDICWEDEILDCDDSLAAIPDKATLTVVKAQPSITLMTPLNKKMHVKIRKDNLGDTVNKFVYSHIMKQEGVELDMQQIHLYHNGRALQGTCTLEKCGFIDGSILYLRTPAQPSIGVTGEMSGPFHIMVILPHGAETTLSVKPSDEVKTVKNHLEAVAKLQASRGILYFCGEELQDDRTLAYYGVPQGGVLTIDVAVSLRIVSSRNNHVDIQASVSQTVESFISLLASHLSIDPEHVELYFGDIEMAKDATLAELNICTDGCVVRMNNSFSLNIFTSWGKCIQLNVRTQDTVKSIKEQLVSYLKVEPENQMLAFNGLNLLADRTLAYYDIIDSRCPLSLEVNIKIHVNDPVNLTLVVKSSDSVKSIKEYICREESDIHPSQLVLFYEGVEMSDSCTLPQCNIMKDGACLDLATIICVLMPDSRPIHLTVRFSETVLDVKKSLEVESGIRADCQVLRECGNDIEFNDKLVLWHHSNREFLTESLNLTSKEIILTISDSCHVYPR